jgi:hypothetical protein
MSLNRATARKRANTREMRAKTIMYRETEKFCPFTNWVKRLDEKTNTRMPIIL